MLKILKNLFTKKKPVAEEVAFADVEQWLDGKIRQTTLPQELSGLFDELSKSFKVLDSSLMQLSVKQLNLPEEQNIVIQEHKRELLTKLYTLQKQISTSPKRDYASLVNYDETLSVVAAQMKQLLREASIRKLLPQEFSQLDEALTAAESIQVKLHNLIHRKQGLSYVYTVKRIIREVEKKQELAQHFKAQIEAEQQKQQSLQEMISRFETDLDDLKTSPEFEKYDELATKKIRLEKDLEREQARFSSLFSPLAKMLKQYDLKEAGADRALARQYAENPVQTLLSDKNLWLISLLQNVTTKLPDLEQDERKRKEFREAQLSFSESFLRDLLARMTILKEATASVERQLRIDITTTKISDIHYKMSHVKSQVQSSNESMAKLNQQLSELIIEKDLLMLERQLQSFADVKLK